MIPQEILPDARILIVRLSSIGDVLHTTTVVHNLKLRYPNCHITWLVSPPASELLTYSPDIDRLLIWDRRPLDKSFSRFNVFGAWGEISRAEDLMKKYEYDIAIDLQGLSLTGILTKKSGAPYRIGIHERNEPNSMFMTDMAPETRHIHKVRRYATALDLLGIRGLRELGPVIGMMPNYSDFVDRFFLKNDIRPSVPILMVCVRTSWETKNWAPKNFALALRNIPESVQIVFCGSADDEQYIKIVQRGMERDSISIAGKVNLLELAAIFKKCALLLTCDTGPLHIAEAVGLNTLSLWGPTDPEMYGPLTKGHRTMITESKCKFCNKTKCREGDIRCMKAIYPDLVERRLLDLLHIRTADSSRVVTSNKL